MAHPLTEAEHRTTLELYEKHGTSELAGRAIGLSSSAFRERVRKAEIALGVSVARKASGGATVSTEDLQSAVDAYTRVGTKAGAAFALGIPPSTLNTRLEAAERAGLFPSGDDEARKPRILPYGKGVKRYILTCAQSDTMLYEKAWSALHALAEHYGAEVMVSTFSYKHRQQGSAKRGTVKTAVEEWYDSRIEPFVVDEMVQLAPGLVWNGHMNILPTAVDPLSGLHNYNGRASSIFPHAKVAMQSVPTIQSDAAKLQYTTGTVTKRNYIQKKAGQKAEFDHVYGGMIVEVDEDGHWWCRQLNVDSKGRLYDLDLMVAADGSVTTGHKAEAIVWGDIHVRQLEPKMHDLCWGEGGILETLSPKFQFLHDVLDFESQSHHNRRDPHKMFSLQQQGRAHVEGEIEQVADFLHQSSRKGTRSVVVQSNHDLHLERWLKEVDWREDLQNAQFYMEANSAYLAALAAGEDFNALRWAVRRAAKSKCGFIRWLSADESFIICKDASGGIEMALHGDRGPNGSRGSLRNLSRLGRRVCIGHSHTAGIFNGAWQSGVTARLGMDYAKGSPSSWSATHILVQPNGKRQLITIFADKWRA